MIEIAKLQLQKNFIEAIIRIDEFLSNQLPEKVQVDFYAMKSSILERMGSYAEAKKNVIKAHIIRKYFSVTLVIFLILLGCVRDDKEISTQKVNNDDDPYSYDKTFNRFKQHNWFEEQNPFDLMTFCESLVGTGREHKFFIKKSNAPDFIIIFANAFTSTLKGEFENALMQFQKIDGSSKERFWRAVGELETLLYMERISDMKIILGVLESANEGDLFSSYAVPHYKAYYNYLSGNLSETERIIKDYEVVLKQDEVLQLKVLLSIHKNDIDKAESLIRNAPHKLKTEDIILIESNVIRLKSGESAWLEFLKKAHELQPHLYLVEFEYSKALILSGQIKEGFKIMKELRKKYPYDYEVKLTFVEYLISYAQSKSEITHALEILKTNIQNLRNVPFFHIAMAQASLLREDLSSARKHVEVAKVMFPKGSYVLWMDYELSIAENDLYSAEEALKELIDLDPNDIDVLYELLEVYYSSEKWDLFLSVLEKLENAERFISNGMKDKIESMKAQYLLSEEE